MRTNKDQMNIYFKTRSNIQRLLNFNTESFWPVFAIGMMFLGTSCQQKMSTQGKLRTFQESRMFEDHSLARPRPNGVVGRNDYEENDQIALGTENSVESANEDLVMGSAVGSARLVKINPLPITRATMSRGQERYKIYCSPCHGDAGYADGRVVQRGFPAPPSYHTDRLRNVADGYIYQVIKNGYGAMYGYGDRIEINDRWAIVSYVRALQLSQNFPEAQLTEAEKKELAP